VTSGKQRTAAAAIMVTTVIAMGSWCGASAQESAASRPALGGVWQLNRDLSAAPGSGPDGQSSAPGGGGRGGAGGGMGRPGGMGGPGGGGGGRGGPGGGRPDEQQMQQMRDTMRELLQPSARLTIVHREDTVSFTDDAGHVRKFVANGKKEKHQLQAATIETKSTWKNGALVIEWETGRGPTVTRTYRVDPALHRLVIETTMKGGRGPGGDRPPIAHVYDAVE
jgi:hypothetical protein